jgi:transcriptional regulator with XRE-family HTH domain
MKINELSVLPGRIKEERERIGLSQGSLGELVGLRRDVVTKIERGDRDVSHYEAVAFAAVFGIDVDDLTDAGDQILFRDREETPEAQEAIDLLRAFAHNWETIDALRALDAE